MQTEVTVLADSVSPDGVRLTTLLAVYPRFIHSEMLRHRMFSHSVASSRAIPTEKNIEQVRVDPFIPSTFNRRVKGMGVGDELDETLQTDCRDLWIRAANVAADVADSLNANEVDKSRANRLLEPFLYVADIITATEWDNFFALRDHPAAQPEFQELAHMMRVETQASVPDQLDYDYWHLPLVTKSELADLCNLRIDLEVPQAVVDVALDQLKEASASRCAAISFDKHAEGEDVEASLNRFNRLAQASPPHLSPLEHVARPFNQGEIEMMKEIKSFVEARRGSDWGNDVIDDWKRQVEFCGNLCGWVQMRKTYVNEHRADLLTATAQEA